MRAAIARLWRADERECVPPLIAAAQLDAEQSERVASRTRSLIEGMWEQGGGEGVEALTRAFPLNSPAGLALLSLAESLLRVPDQGNVDRLLRDRLGLIDWSAQPRGGFLSGSLSLASRLVRDSSITAKVATPIVRLVAQLAIKALGAQFVFAQDIHSALRRSHRGDHRNYRYSFDMLGEAALTDRDAQRYLQSYERAIHAVGVADRGRGPSAGGSVSVKLSALHPRYHYSQRDRVMQELLPRLLSLARLARQYNIALAVDAEESERLELSLDLIEAVMAQSDLAEWSGFGVVIQAYQKRAPAVIDYLMELAGRRRARLMVRLVKGAYWDAEIKLSQVDGLNGYPVYTRKVYTDVAYIACARKLLSSRERVMPQFATHNAQTVATILELSAGRHVDDFEFQCLFGMGAGLYKELMQNAQIARPVRIYAPVGTRPALLAYLMRRLLENGAAASFVQRAASGAAAIDSLIADPARQAALFGGTPHPGISAPLQIFAPERRNSSGVDLANEVERAPLLEALERSRSMTIGVTSQIARAAHQDRDPTGVQREIRNPADRRDLVAMVLDATPFEVNAALAAATEAAPGWAQIEIDTRASILEHAAELFEADRSMLVALAVRESGKTLSNAVGEVREAVDFLRYYAAQIRAQFSQSTHLPLGVVVCISPWNFPLAIFTGQLAAALAAGNVVIAKPAEQSSAIAWRAVNLLHQAGVPAAALQLLPGDGEQIGGRLVADVRVKGVVFTGSTAAARSIARQLAARGEVPFIAETGGQNAMIVDSTALPEQVVGDVLRSAFDSAGQRCSALRVLCLQREIADPMLAMLEGAMRELRVGDPANIATDVGPLIDEEARERIESHLQAMGPKIRARSALTDECASGVFVAPTLIEIQSVDELRQEVFGPVLHVLRFERQKLASLIDSINATGYGLTLGIASRIEDTIQLVRRRAHAGNIYVNRNVIGAVVGLQPFGGHGLSGTGPKAGGPLYLHRLLSRGPGPAISSHRSTGAPALLQQFVVWLRESRHSTLNVEQRASLLSICERYAASTLPAAQIALSGYVGESDELRLLPRGVLRATARSEAALLGQLAAALASGNTLNVDRPELLDSLRSSLPATLRAVLTRSNSQAQVQAILIDGNDAQLNPHWVVEVCSEVAAQSGAIVTVVVGQDGYALERLLLEKTVTINTAAVGGDIRLLALDDTT